jgi:tetratricopeptide (TPR) repeat protein
VPPARSGVDPALDAQTRLLESAYRAFVQERYPLASAIFQRFVDSNPASPRLSEARWWLARSYEERGDLPAALSAYRAVVGEAPRSTPLVGSYEFHALNRLDAFRRSLGPSSLLEHRQMALWLTSADWLTIPDVGLWIAQLADAGVTSLIVEAGSPSRETMQSGPIGVYFQTSKVPVIEDRFTVIVPAAHAKGMAVLASINLHEPGWMAVNPEWSIAMALASLGLVTRGDGDGPAARALYREGVSLSQRLGDRRGIGWHLVGMATSTVPNAMRTKRLSAILNVVFQAPTWCSIHEPQGERPGETLNLRPFQSKNAGISSLRNHKSNASLILPQERHTP